MSGNKITIPVGIKTLGYVVDANDVRIPFKHSSGRLTTDPAYCDDPGSADQMTWNWYQLKGDLYVDRAIC